MLRGHGADDHDQATECHLHSAVAAEGSAGGRRAAIGGLVTRAGKRRVECDGVEVAVRCELASHDARRCVHRGRCVRVRTDGAQSCVGHGELPKGRHATHCRQREVVLSRQHDHRAIRGLADHEIAPRGIVEAENAGLRSTVLHVVEAAGGVGNELALRQSVFHAIADAQRAVHREPVLSIGGEDGGSEIARLRVERAVLHAVIGAGHGGDVELLLRHGDTGHAGGARAGQQHGQARGSDQDARREVVVEGVVAGGVLRQRVGDAFRRGGQLRSIDRDQPVLAGGEVQHAQRSGFQSGAIGGGGSQYGLDDRGAAIAADRIGGGHGGRQVRERDTGGVHRRLQLVQHAVIAVAAASGDGTSDDVDHVGRIDPRCREGLQQGGLCCDHIRIADDGSAAEAGDERLRVDAGKLGDQQLAQRRDVCGGLGIAGARGHRVQLGRAIGANGGQHAGKRATVDADREHAIGVRRRGRGAR